MHIPIKLTWQERIVSTHSYHIDQITTNEEHTIEDTAKLLNRSKGSVAEDLMLYSWSRTYSQILDFNNQYDALAFARKKKRELALRK